MSAEEGYDSADSSDEALCEVLGIPSLSIDFDAVVLEPDTSHKSVDDLVQKSDEEIQSTAERLNLRKKYEEESYCIFPEEWSVPPYIMRRLTDELSWGGEKVLADRSYETIQLYKNGEIYERRALTRFENFVSYHKDWDRLCNQYLRRLVSLSLETNYVLFKEKLNMKPPGGSGFAPHLDGPSLRLALGNDGPKSFLTVMVAIDDMTVENGCLRIAKGSWNEVNTCPTMEPEQDGNPDAGGRAGAIALSVCDEMEFQDIDVRAGTIVVFNAWVPHRSSVNRSPFPRRAVFLTYNLEEEGDFHDQYYTAMAKLRNDWRARSGLARTISLDEKAELFALQTIPKV